MEDTETKNKVSRSSNLDEEKSQPDQQTQQPNRTRKRHGARNQHRHKSFTRWLLQTFPHINPKEEDEQQRSESTPTHVLDVAGGKGELAARLTFCHHIKVIMVDPREAQLQKCFEEIVLKNLPKKWQVRYRTKLEEDPTSITDGMNRKYRQLVMRFDDDTVEKCPELREAVENASLLVGMHSDGATEAIVDAALKFQKPFVVIPCCVFPNFFPLRQVVDDDGNYVRVRTHEEFCRYLHQKDERFVLEKIPIEGRNMAIWWDGQI